MPRALSASDRRTSCLRLVLPISRIGLTALLILISCTSVFSQARKPTEYEVKAAYLYNFGKFIRWPSSASSDSHFSICIFGTDPFGNSLDGITSGESLDGKRLAVRRINSASEVQGCRILFISRSEQGRASSVLSAVKHLPILTVSDMPDFVDNGGIIGFVMQGDRVRFQVSLPAAERAGLSLSSELLRVAANVKRES